MTGDHYGRTARMATLLVTATDEILGTHTAGDDGCGGQDKPHPRGHQVPYFSG
jgi:hypothetical protein